MTERMEMRAGEGIGIGEDLTPPLPPLAFSLYDSFLLSHCSACSLPLSISHFTPTRRTNLPSYPSHPALLRYCSPFCSSLDSPLHYFSSEPLLLLSQSPPSTCPPLHHGGDSSHLRLSLRLLHILFEKNQQNDAAAIAQLDRIGGLITNYGKFEDHDVLGMVREVARAMTTVLAGKLDGDGKVEEAVMCLVLSNAVEVQDKNGRNVGIAVYDWRFSWINHSCSPNACYRFTTIVTPLEVERESPRHLRIYPAATDGGDGGGACDSKRSEGYGPRIVIRSIKEIKEDEEVTIAYTDLLQPKEMRQSELFTKYQFNCCCKRCTATPATYVDHALQKISVCSLDGQNVAFEGDFYGCKATEQLMDSIDSAIDEYLTFNNPESCCEELEELLMHGHLYEQLIPKPGKSQQYVRLHEFHHLSLQAYTTLASAYRVRASDLLAHNVENHQHQVEAFCMSRISAAYSLLLAAVSHHLFLSESSIIASVANAWKNAGESLVYFSRSSIWHSFSNLQPSVLENSSILSHKCYRTVQLDGFEANSPTSSEDQYVNHGEISRQFLNCIVNLTAKIWTFLTCEGRHLQEVKDLIDFRCLLRVESSVDPETCLTCRDTGSVSRLEADEHQHTHQDRMNLFQLGVHCLLYGSYLSSVCFGQHSQLTCEVVNLLRDCLRNLTTT